uniref:Transposase, Mutator family n=1 Tax=Candidatus Kentrum sp. DK TaxID=2126562 RepID=A0A450SWT3_9GAMM|nr:MAG: hypothetical protein BECKDK2373B_GA0170837_10748 [Candidatus Kentron sp. DK]
MATGSRQSAWRDDGIGYFKRLRGNSPIPSSRQGCRDPVPGMANRRDAGTQRQGWLQGLVAAPARYEQMQSMESESAIKAIFKQALTETLYEQRGLLRDVLAEVMEEIALSQAIAEGSRSEPRSSICSVRANDRQVSQKLRARPEKRLCRWPPDTPDDESCFDLTRTSRNPKVSKTYCVAGDECSEPPADRLWSLGARCTRPQPPSFPFFACLSRALS